MAAGVLLLLWLFPVALRAQITVNGASNTVSTCPNNGSISISATTLSPPLLYSLIAGPVTQPVQTNPVFNSLPPGTYTVKLTDGSGNETTLQVTVPGTYQNPTFTIADTRPYCVGNSNGQLVGNINPGTGTQPFLWQLVAPSPVTTPPQSSSTFTGLPGGNYTMRVTDACGTFSSNAIVLQQPSTQFGFVSFNIGEQGAFSGFQKIGCDSMLVIYMLNIPTPRLPLSFKYNTVNGVYIPTLGTTTIDTSLMHTNGQVIVWQVIPNTDYGQPIRATIYNTCGDSAQSISMTPHPFVFYPHYTFNNCGNSALVTFANTPYQDYHTSVNAPVTYTLTDAANNVLQSTTVPFDQNNGIFGVSSTLTTGNTYHFSITDGCGDTFQSSIVVPGLAPPVIVHEDIFSGACIDSVVGAYRVLTAGFQGNARLIMLSGPSTLGSTKPRFEYTDTYTYPDTVPMVNGESFLMNNLAIGTYHYIIIDDCGNEVPGSITITEDQVTSLKATHSVEKGCPGRNKIFFGMVSGGKVTIRDIGNDSILTEKEFIAYTQNSLAEYYNKDSLINLFDGSYEITYEFLQGPGALENGTQLNDSNVPCWVLVDTVHIAPYHVPEMITGNAIMCHNSIYFVLETDTSTGVAPYEYEIIAGPQTFPVQGSNIFTITQPGTYTARIYDDCGNASIKQITVDTLSFDPIQVTSTCTRIGLALPSTPYDQYEWLLPNGQVYAGDSILIDPITPADTGLYTITKVVDINGCRDTLYSNYHVTLNPQMVQSLEVCSGEGVTVGSHTYTLPGTYTDTLTATGGCDSTIITHLTLLPQVSDSTQLNICLGDSVLIAGVYQHLPGFYTDSVLNTAGCYDLSVTQLTLVPASDTLNADICWGTQYTFGGQQLGQTGTYTDTVSGTGCLSLVTLYLTVLPQKTSTLSKTICQGEQFVFGGNTYTTAGTYTDTLSTPTCDSTVTLTLTVLPFQFNTPDEAICGGDSLQETHLPNTPGLSYQWSPAQWVSNSTIHNPFLFAPTSQVFQIIVSNGICADTLTKNVQRVPVLPPFGQTDSLCAGQSVQIGPNAAVPQLAYSWSPANWLSDPSVANPIASPTVTTTYVLNTHALGNPGLCTGSDTVTLHVVDLNAPTIGYDEFASCYGFSIQVNANGNPAYQYAWFTDADHVQHGNTYTYEIPYDTTVTFHMIVSSAGCTDTISVTKTFESIDTYWGQLALPNVFTPNNDQVNDCFGPAGVPEDCYWLYAYNRWGVLVFDSHKLDKACWDGRYMASGDRLVDGVYFWVMEVGGNEYHGTVTLAGGNGTK